MDFREVEKKWQKKWEEDKLFSFDDSHLEKKLYVLEMFSYPSACLLYTSFRWVGVPSSS